MEAILLVLVRVVPKVMVRVGAMVNAHGNRLSAYQNLQDTHLMPMLEVDRYQVIKN